MIVAIDVYYSPPTAKAVGVLFDWDDTHPKDIIIETLKEVADYEPGAFYKRELPALRAVLNRVDLAQIEAVVIDGHIYVDNNGTFGLGGRLWEALNRAVPVIGVAKTPFFANKETVCAVYRGESKNPLYVSTVGYPLAAAIEHIRNMKGEHRIPTVLKLLDGVTKSEKG